ncbi:MAG: delta-60 repeat domain-containing protein [Blastocatellia bacterium]|nr:delta-60 repeat domain-containing protein [Blastocatellia bacterium]
MVLRSGLAGDRPSRSDGKLVVTGRGSLPGDRGDVITARYDTNGILDTSFDCDGWNLTEIYGGNDLAMAGSIQFDPACSCNRLAVEATVPTGLSPLPQYIEGLRFNL